MIIAQREPLLRYPTSAGSLDLRNDVYVQDTDELLMQLAFLPALPFGVRHHGCNPLAAVLGELHERAVELYRVDAIPSGELRALVDDVIDKHVDPDVLAAAELTEYHERETLRRIALFGEARGDAH